MDKDMALQAIMAGGPDRVYVRDSDGECIGVPSRIARDKYDVMPDIIFLRDDGWSLGAVRGDTESEAYNLWKNDWEFFMLRGSSEMLGIGQYKKMPK